MKGFKVFNPDWTCRGFQFEVGKIYEEDVKPMVCDRGFHFCEKAADCFDFYSFNPENKVAEVEALGEVDSDGKKSCTDKIHIIRELTWHEVLDLVNSGIALDFATVAIGTVAIATVATGTVAIGTVATGTVAIATVATGTVATGTVAIGTRLAFQMVVSIQNHQRFSCSTNLLIGHIRIG